MPSNPMQQAALACDAALSIYREAWDATGTPWPGMASDCYLAHQRAVMAVAERARIPESLDPLRDLYRAIGSNASGAGIDNDKRPSDFKAGMVKAYEHCLELVRARLTAVAEVKRQIAAARSGREGTQ